MWIEVITSWFLMTIVVIKVNFGFIFIKVETDFIVIKIIISFNG